MASDGWAAMPFTDAVTLNPSISIERGKVYPFVEMAAVDPSTRSVRESEYRKFNGSGARFTPGDTLMARITPCLENGKIARFRPSDETSIGFGSTEFIVIRGKEGVTTNDFAYYLTKWDEFRRFAIGQMTGSSGRQRVPADSLAGFEVAIPHTVVQERIADVLGTLDDKIELNRQMNHTMELMAQAIFKSWFIDFDPVVYNAVQVGNVVPERYAETVARYREQPEVVRLPQDVLDMFPDNFEESDLGEIPSGWTVDKLTKIGHLETKSVQPNSEPNTIWEHFSIPAFDQGAEAKTELGSSIKSGKYVVPDNAVLASKLNPQFPRVWLPDPQDPARAICSTEFMPFRPNHEKWRPFLYETLKSDTVQDRIKGFVSGSTGSRQRVKPQDIAAMQIVVPDSRVIDVFCEFVGPLHAQKLANQRSSTRLSDLRDTLLPKLVSGELRVHDAEKLLEGAE